MQSASTHFIPRPLSRSEVREVDRMAVEAYGMTSLVLMENAGSGAARVIDAVAPAGAVVVLCGSGNNAGDGYVVARHLQLMGRDVTILQLADPQRLRGDASANWQIASLGKLPAEVVDDPTHEAFHRRLAAAGTIVDAMLGTGASGDPRPPLSGVIQAANHTSACRVALDLPSGLDCDTGQPGEPCFRAHHTCTFVAAKVGFDGPQAQTYLGEVHIVPIGVPRDLLERF